MSSQVIEIRAAYCLLDGQQADLLLEAELQQQTFLTIIHERAVGDLRVQSYDFAGSISQRFVLATGESLTLIGRRNGHIIGCLVNEVDARPESRVLLRPKGGYNLIIYPQCCSSLVQVSPDHQEASPVHLTPATHVLASLLRATRAHYARLCRSLPSVIQLLLPSMEEAVAANEERHSQQMLGLYCIALSELGINQVKPLSCLFQQAESLLTVQL